MRPLCYLLAATWAAAVMTRGTSETGAAAAGPEPERGAPPADKPAVEVTAYVPTTTHVAGLGRGQGDCIFARRYSTCGSRP